MLAGARSYRQVHAFIRTHLDRLNSGFGLSLRRAPVRFILHGLVSCEEDKCRIRNNPGIMARARSFALNILRKNRVTNVAKALWDGALSLDHILAYKKI